MYTNHAIVWKSLGFARDTPRLDEYLNQGLPRASSEGTSRGVEMVGVEPTSKAKSAVRLRT